MMQPYKVEIYLYANSPEEAAEAKNAAREFVMHYYNNGCIVTASRFAEVLRRFKDNAFVTNFLRK